MTKLPPSVKREIRARIEASSQATTESQLNRYLILAGALMAAAIAALCMSGAVPLY